MNQTTGLLGLVLPLQTGNIFPKSQACLSRALFPDHFNMRCQGWNFTQSRYSAIEPHSLSKGLVNTPDFMIHPTQFFPTDVAVIRNEAIFINGIVCYEL